MALNNLLYIVQGLSMPYYVKPIHTTAIPTPIWFSYPISGSATLNECIIFILCRIIRFADLYPVPLLVKPEALSMNYEQEKNSNL